MATYSIRWKGKAQVTAETLDGARSMGAFILKQNPYGGSVGVFRGTSLVGLIDYDYKVDLYTWKQNMTDPVRLLDPITGKTRVFPKGMFLIKYMKNGGIKEAVINVRSMDDLRRKIIDSFGEASVENSRYIGNVMYREGRYIWRVPVDLKTYVFRDTDIDPRTGKLVGVPRKHAPYEKGAQRTNRRV